MTCATAVAGVTSRPDDWRPAALVILLFAFSAAEVWRAPQVHPDASEQWGVVTSAAPWALTITLLGPASALAIAVATLTIDTTVRRNGLHHYVENLANYATFLVSGALLSRLVAEASGLGPDDPAFAVITLGAYVYIVAASDLYDATYQYLSYGDSFGEQYRMFLRPQLGAEVPIALLTTAAVYAYGTLGLAALGSLVLVQLLFHFLFQELMLSQRRSAELEQHAERLSVLSASQRRLVDQVIDAEERERRRLAESLHDEALQSLLTARQELPATPAGARAGTGIDRAIEQLRHEIFELHPAVLERAGLAAALRAVAEQRAATGGFDARVVIDADAVGFRDQLLFTLGREQLTNAAKHARASEVVLRLSRGDHALVMEVSDDGCGMSGSDRHAALKNGHIGLAASREQVEAVGGGLEISSEAGQGTRIRTSIPLPGSDERA